MIIIGYISPGQVATRFTDSLLGVFKDPRVVGHISVISGPRIAQARNDMVSAFLSDKSKPQWLLMVDSDMIFEPSIIDDFLNAAHEKLRPVVGGLCFGGGRVGQPFPTLYKLVDPNKNGGKFTEVIRDYPKNALCKVAATGAACLFIHRDVLLQMQDKFAAMPDSHRNPHPWFAETVQGGHEYGEDWTFCMRLQHMKIPLYVHTGIKLGHVKTQIYDEDFYLEYRRTHGYKEDG